MKLVGLVGFLGAGKTTALLALAQDAASRGAKVAIVVNEIGDIGIDNALLRRLGSRVWELVGGCICCTLAGELVGTLNDVAKRYAPDIVFLEPSGASHPDTILNALEHGKDLPISSTRWVAVVDPLRLDMLIAVVGPLIEAHLACADAAIVVKADIATAEELQAAKEWISNRRPGLPTFIADMKSPGHRPAIEELMPWR